MVSYIQCKDLNEVEKALKGRGHAFVTEDFRIYDKLMLSNDVAFEDIDSKEMVALAALKHDIEILDYEGFEMTFTTLVENAKMVEESYRKVREILKPKEAS